MKQWIPVAVIALSFCIAGCGAPPQRDAAEATIQSDLTVEDVLERMDRGLLRGEMLIARLLPESTILGGTPIVLPDDLEPRTVWIDASAGQGRTESRLQPELDGPLQVHRTIIRDGRAFEVDGNGNSREAVAPVCYPHSTAVLALLLGCSRNASSSSLVPASSGGEPALALAFRGEQNSDGPEYFERRVLVDPETYLPLAIEHRSSRGDPSLRSYDIGSTVRIEIEFVERDSLPKSFFDPVSIGFVASEPIPADNLRPDVNGVRLYWIGAEFDAGMAGPLVLEQPRVYPGDASPGYVAGLSYSVGGDPGGYRGLGIEVYSLDDEDRLQDAVSRDWTGHDITEETVSLGDGRAVIFRMETKYGDLYRAHVYYDTAIVVVHDYFGAPPYTGREAFMQVLSALRPYTP